jgi:hypothetical protein
MNTCMRVCVCAARRAQLHKSKGLTFRRYDYGTNCSNLHAWKETCNQAQ